MKKRELIHLSRITFRKLNTSKWNCNKISQVLRDDVWWQRLSPEIHQQIGRCIAKYPDYFEKNCNVQPKKTYIYTDAYGNGIYM